MLTLHSSLKNHVRNNIYATIYSSLSALVITAYFMELLLKCPVQIIFHLIFRTVLYNIIILVL